MKPITIIKPLLFFLLLVFTATSEKLKKPTADLITLSKRRKPIVNTIEIFDSTTDIWNSIEQTFEIKHLSKRMKQQYILQELIAISYKLTSIDKKVRYFAGNILASIIQVLPSVLQIELRLQEVSQIKSQLMFAEKKLQHYLIKAIKSLRSDEIRRQSFNNYSQAATIKAECEAISILQTEKYTLEEFAKWGTSISPQSPMALLSRLHDIILPFDDSDSGLFDLLLNEFQEMQSNLCNMRQSPHQTLYNLYNTIALAELKGYAIIQFSYFILRMYNKGDFIKEALSAQQEYKKRTKEKIKEIKKTLVQADRSVYKCDPKQHVEGVTYVKLTKLLQGYIENEVNLNPYGTCRENCKYYSNTQYHGCYKNQFCAHQPPCPGRVLDCHYVDSDMNICISSNSERRYDWVKYENGKTLGTTGVCERHNFYKVDSWWRYLFWHCSYCLCLCDNYQYDSERYFSLQDVTSDTKDNKIVTGVRIVKHNSIIHFQIQQGVLKPRGVVDKKSLAWKAIDNYSIENQNVENNVNYTTLGWFDRSIDIDDVILPSEHVVTGVRFRKIGNHLNLEVRATPIHFTSGKVSPSHNSFWMGNDNTEANWNNPRNEIFLHNPDIPIRHGPHILNSKHDYFVQFQPTSFEKDAGQSTVPFLDSQPLTSQGFPISGIGLIHRGQDGSGGFIAPKLFSFDFEPFINL